MGQGLATCPMWGPKETEPHARTLLFSPQQQAAGPVLVLEAQRGNSGSPLQTAHPYRPSQQQGREHLWGEGASMMEPGEQPGKGRWGGGSQQTNRVPRPGGSRCVSIRFCWAPAAQVKGGRIWLPPPQTSPRGQGPSLSSISSGEPGSPQGHTSQQAAELGTTTIRKHRERHPDFAQVAPCPHPCPAPVHSPYPTPTAAPIPPWLSTYPSWVGARDESQHRKTEGREGRETPELAPLVANLSSISSNPYAPE